MLSDFGGYPPGDPAEQCYVEGLDQLQSVVARCFEHARRMRVRCFAHSMNGMSVPTTDETLLDLRGVRHVRWQGEGVIAAGAGLSVWELDQYVRQFGWKLPVINDGGAEAPSIGGFVAAGGIGEGTVFYGGFWETVREITLVTANGLTHRVGDNDAIFPWLFGSMGTLGIVYEATLNLVLAGEEAGLAVPSTASLPRSTAAQWPDHLWLTLFVAARDRERGLDSLRQLIGRHPRAWQPNQMYEYYLLHRRFNPPLLFEPEGDFVALGIWGDRLGDDADQHSYLGLEADFQTLVTERGFRRYFQSEMIRMSRPLESYVGRECAERYAAVKQAADPRGLLNAFMPDRRNAAHRA